MAAVLLVALVLFLSHLDFLLAMIDCERFAECMWGRRIGNKEPQEFKAYISATALLDGVGADGRAKRRNEDSDSDLHVDSDEVRRLPEPFDVQVLRRERDVIAGK